MCKVFAQSKELHSCHKIFLFMNTISLNMIVFDLLPLIMEEVRIKQTVVHTAQKI